MIPRGVSLETDSYRDPNGERGRSMGKSTELWGAGLLGVALLSGVLLCMPALRGQALVLDEHVSHYCSGAPTLEELWKRTQEAAVLPPLSHLLERMAIAIGGKSESTFRLPSLVAYVLAIPAAWWAGRAMGGAFAGGLAALLVAWHPGTLDEVRFARCYGLVLLLSSLSTGAVLRWRVARDRPAWLVPWALAAAGLCWTHYLAAPLVAAHVVLILTSLSGSQSTRRNSAIPLATIAAVGFSCVPLMPAILRLRDWSAVIEFQRVPATIPDALGWKWTLPALVVVALLLAWERVRIRRTADVSEPKRERRPSILWPLVLWLLPLAVVAAMALSGSPMLASPRYRVMVVCPSAVALAVALSRACSAPVAMSIAVGLLSLSIGSHGSSPLVAGRLANPVEEQWRRIGLELRPQCNNPTVLVFTQSGLAEGVILPVMATSTRFRAYVACRMGSFYTGSERAQPIPLLWDGSGKLRDEYRSRLRTPGLREVWIVAADDTDLNAQSVPPFSRLIEQSGFQQVSAESRPGILVIRFAPAAGRNPHAAQEM